MEISRFAQGDIKLELQDVDIGELIRLSTDSFADAMRQKGQRLDLDLATREIGYLQEKLVSERRVADAELASLREKRDRADQRVREIQDAIRRMSVSAPRDGTVIYVSNWRDAKKKVGDSCWREEKVVEVPDLERMKAQGEVDEAGAGKIAVGQRVSLRLDAHPGLEFVGKAKSIWGTVQRKSWNNPLKVVRLDIELERTPRPGTAATAWPEPPGPP